VGLGGLEPPTSRLSGVRSNQLSYRPTPRSVAEEIEPVEAVVASTALPRLGFSEPAVPRDSPAGGTFRARPAHRPGSSRPQAPEREKNSARATKAREVDLGSARVRWEPAAPTGLPRKEVIQPHLPVRLPCYDLAPITGLTLGACLLTVGMATSGATDFRGLTGGVYKARERIHRCLLISDY
jgi:hypothetical protein